MRNICDVIFIYALKGPFVLIWEALVRSSPLYVFKMFNFDLDFLMEFIYLTC